jgi:hypothetical protein
MGLSGCDDAITDATSESGLCPSGSRDLPRPLLTQQALFATISLLLNGSAYPEWLRGQALGSHSNLVQSPRC